ncbi:selenium binding protein [Ancylostoma caninum]|uniref:Methanethiol oxidase n=1 Tax=Ancylostoma caninum TaxID=29170 RepID=A0A368GWT4_ANCCA|nr:selenium binding protein [Ancylostoma caninum]
MISTLGDADGNHKGNFILLDGKTFEPKACWLDEEKSVAFNYDFWYQPRRDVMISTEWGTPYLIKKGFDPKHAVEGTGNSKGHYGHSVHLFKWSTHEKLQTIELPKQDGAVPLEVRFKHDPASPYAFVGTALGSSVFLLKPGSENSNSYVAKRVARIPPKQVEGWLLPEMPSLITDILISMDDRFLYISNWLHGDIRQYDITDPENIRLTGQIFIGGSIHTESGVNILNDLELKARLYWVVAVLFGPCNIHSYEYERNLLLNSSNLQEPPAALYVKGKRIEGGPQMLQLSLDGKRLYVTTSLYRQWDEQFYPKMMKTGAVMLCIDVGDNGGMTLNENFLFEFGAIEGGPYLGHEMRYPGGDCTSDIWI